MRNKFLRARRHYNWNGLQWCAQNAAVLFQRWHIRCIWSSETCFVRHVRQFQWRL